MLLIWESWSALGNTSTRFVGFMVINGPSAVALALRCILRLSCIGPGTTARIPASDVLIRAYSPHVALPAATSPIGLTAKKASTTASDTAARAAWCLATKSMSTLDSSLLTSPAQQ